MGQDPRLSLRVECDVRIRSEALSSEFECELTRVSSSLSSDVAGHVSRSCADHDLDHYTTDADL